MNTLNKKAALPIARALRNVGSKLNFGLHNSNWSPKQRSMIKELQRRGLTREPLLSPYKSLVAEIGNNNQIHKSLDLPQVSGALDNLKHTIRLARIRGLDIPNLRYLNAQVNDAAKVKYIRDLVNATASNITASKPAAKPSLMRRFINRLLNRSEPTTLKSNRAFTPTEAGILGIPQNVAAKYGVLEQVSPIKMALQPKATRKGNGKKQLQNYSQGIQAYLDAQLAGTRARLNDWLAYDTPAHGGQLGRYLFDMQNGYYSKAYADNAWRAAHGSEATLGSIPPALQPYSIYRNQNLKKVYDEIKGNSISVHPEQRLMSIKNSLAATPSVSPSSKWVKIPDYTL